MGASEIKNFSVSVCEPEWLLAQRLTAFEAFEELEPPFFERIKFERWGLSGSGSVAIGETAASGDVPDFTAVDGPLVVQVGSQTVYQQLPQALVDAGVVFTDFSSALTEIPELMKNYLGRVIAADEDQLAAANLASFNSGLVLYVPANVTIDAPLEAQIFHHSDSYIPFNKRILIIAGENAKFSYLERLRSTLDGTDKTTGNVVVEVIAEAGAEVKYSALDELNEHLNVIIRRRGLIGENASVDWSLGIMNAGNVVYDVDSELRGIASRSTIKAVGISAGRQVQGVNTRVTNYGRQSVGHIRQNGVILEHGTLTFNGIGHIINGASGADAQQSSKVLMLSDGARGDANPILLIDENDVTAGHAASVGQIDADDMYYLMSRGLDEQTAKRLVIRGFLGSVVTEIPVKSVRDEFIATIDRKLGFS
ncbi:MAG: Fe-S cluster assembly protein SufD [Streptococcaceae bacterium]|jgi:Fe-S cluster assembly protein SufD|nr:Fe-S cluster assembly protein SufD [Streptococcaceae bacterium]